AHCFNPFKPYAEHYEDGKPAFLAMDAIELKIGVWHGDGERLDVRPTDPTVVSIRAGAVPFANTPNVEYYTLTAIRPGNVKIEAKLRGTRWASMPLSVGPPTSTNREIPAPPD